MFKRGAKDLSTEAAGRRVCHKSATWQTSREREREFLNRHSEDSNRRVKYLHFLALYDCNANHNFCLLIFCCREKMAQAYDFALDKIGMDVLSYPIWVEYIAFLKSV